ncbi:MAG: tetratricopeptide repeat protein [Candidatus Eisenbacteria bacterium]
MTSQNAPKPGRGSLALPLLLFILLVTVWVYLPAGQHGFLRYDDDLYVTANEMVLRGVSWPGFLWSWTAAHASNWHPVTWWSHMIDVQVFGLRAAAHHWVNVVLHLGTTLLLFYFLRRTTGAVLRSGFVAAVFALHPLHVQSVAWVAERKDVLSSAFWILAILAYAAYVQGKERARGAYVLALLLFAFGLLSKPMLVTLPFLLLLLDHWPLRRKDPWAFRVREKAPFFMLSVVCALVTWSVQSSAGSVKSIPIGERVANAFASYLRYVENAFWPDSLAVFYPMTDPGRGLVLGGAALVVLVIVFSVLSWRRLPWLAVGGLWYLGTLVPVIGIVQAGGQAMADRYMYVPIIGLAILVAWGVGAIFEGRGMPSAGQSAERPVRAYVGAASIVVVVFALAIPARREVGYWRDDLSLFSRALAVTTDNHVAHAMLGVALAESGKLEEALSHEAEAVRIRPDYPVAQSNLGKVLFRLGHHADAEAALREAIRLEPSAVAHLDLASVLLSQQKLGGAIEESQAATELDPGLAAAHSTLATALTLSGKFDLAIASYDRAIACDPSYVDAYVNRGITLQAMGRSADAAASFREALARSPEHPTARARLDALEAVGVR